MRFRSGSIHTELPVNPRWPNEDAEKKRPEDAGSPAAPIDGVSQPSAQLASDEMRWRRMNS